MRQRKQTVIKQPKYLMAATLIVVISAGIISVGIGSRKTPVEKFKENNTIAKQIVNLPNGTFKMRGTMLWHDRNWAKVQFDGLEGTVELPYDGKAIQTPITGAVTLQSGSGSVRIMEVKR